MKKTLLILAVIAAVLAAAAASIQQAMEHCAANIGTGHICGWLAVTL